VIPLALSVTAFVSVSLAVYAILGRPNVGAAARARLGALGVSGSGDVPVWLDAELLKPRRTTHLPLLEMLIQRQGWAAQAEMQLAQADIPMRISEYVLLRLAGAIVFFFAASTLGAPIYIALPAGAAGYLIPRAWLSIKRRSRLDKLNRQLPEAVQLVSSSLKAGFALLQALEAASERMPEPTAGELRRTIKDVGLGANMEDAIVAWGQRIPGPDLEIIVNAILIQRTVGGNLGEILDIVGHTMRERERLHGEIRALTAQQRLSGFVVGGLPIGLAVVLFLINPEYMSPLIEETAGRILLLAAICMEAFSFFLIKKILDIDI
jgi:tight adherence protein B